MSKKSLRNNNLNLLFTALVGIGVIAALVFLKPQTPDVNGKKVVTQPLGGSGPLSGSGTGEATGTKPSFESNAIKDAPVAGSASSSTQTPSNKWIPDLPIVDAGHGKEGTVPQNLVKENIDDDSLRAAEVELPEDLETQLKTPPPELPEDLKRQLASPPPELPDDLKAQLRNPPPPLPEDIKRALQTPPRIVSIDEVNSLPPGAE